MAARNQVTIYFDTPDQLREFRIQAAKAGLSMAELGKRTLVKEHALPGFFLPLMPDESCKCTTEAA